MDVMKEFEAEMNKAFQKLAAEIIPNDEYLKKANVCADQIIKLLQRESGFDIGRVVIAGSSGKKTTIIDSDMDVVLFINGKLPPFKDVLEEFEDILTITDSFGIRDVRKRKHSIQLKAMDFDFDILPAVNFNKLIEHQRQRVLAEIKKDPKNGYMYSSSLADAVVRFMKDQSGFVNEIVRIAKFWYKTLHFEKYKSGAKYCIELIAVYAANQEEEMVAKAKQEGKLETKSYLRVFKNFIDYLRNFDNLNVYFGNAHQTLDKYRVIDPVNPYNNLAKNWNCKSIKLVKDYANESYWRLHSLENSRRVNLDQLFEAQPVRRSEIRDFLGYNPNSKRSQWLVGTIATVSYLPDLKVRNEDFHTDSHLRDCLKILKEHFMIAIYSSKSSSYDIKKIQEVVQNTIDKQFSRESTWSTAENEKHEDYDITFTIPSSNQKSMRISYRL